MDKHRVKQFKNAIGLTVTAQLRNSWTRGFAAALSEMHMLTHDSTSAQAAARSAGLTIAEASKADVPAFDLGQLTKAGIP